MTRKMVAPWKDFESRVRKTAEYLWEKPSRQDHIAGVQIDCVIERKVNYWILMEITTENNLNKVRDDIIKLKTARNALFSRNIYCECYFVTSFDPTPAMVAAGGPDNINVLSFSDLEKQFFNFDIYVTYRQKKQFGSSIDPLTAEPDTSDYIPVKYISMNSRHEYNIENLATKILKNQKLILLGEYGTGKSRCIRELYNVLSKNVKETGVFPLAIDLRDSWGLRNKNEIIRRHFDNLTLFNLADGALKSLDSGGVCVLIDGFDEVGTQGWSDDQRQLKNLRYISLEGTRDLLSKCKNGMVICGREHYFNNNAEMFYALGLAQEDTEIIKCPDEFTAQEMQAFLLQIDPDLVLPKWLPRRPLVCQVIAKIDEDRRKEIFSASGHDVEFWDTFLDVVARRDATIQPIYDQLTIKQVLRYLSRITRTQGGNVGPITLRDVTSAFKSARGVEPVEQASTLLQRLPGLGRVEAETEERRFVDMFFLDGLRALDVDQCVIDNEQYVLEESWQNPLQDLGQRILAQKMLQSDALSKYLKYARKCVSHSNKVLAGDIISSALRNAGISIDFKDIIVDEAQIWKLDLRSATLKNLTITGGIIYELILPKRLPRKVFISDCTIGTLRGVTSYTAIPPWITEVQVDYFEEIETISDIRKIDLNVPQRIFLTIIKKVFFQKGGGRKEEALIRGLGQIDDRGYTKKILSLLKNEGIINSFPGKEGLVYTPVLKHRKRMGQIMHELEISEDELWKRISRL